LQSPDKMAYPNITTHLLNGNANSERIDGTFNKHFFFLISADCDRCQQQLLACSSFTKRKKQLLPGLSKFLNQNIRWQCNQQ